MLFDEFISISQCLLPSIICSGIEAPLKTDNTRTASHNDVVVLAILFASALPLVTT